MRHVQFKLLSIIFLVMSLYSQQTYQERLNEIKRRVSKNVKEFEADVKKRVSQVSQQARQKMQYRRPVPTTPKPQVAPIATPLPQPSVPAAGEVIPESMPEFQPVKTSQPEGTVSTQAPSVETIVPLTH